MVLKEHSHRRDDPRSGKPQTDRHQRQAYKKLFPAKHGAGGKFVWGSPESELKDCVHVTAADAEAALEKPRDLFVGEKEQEEEEEMSWGEGSEEEEEANALDEYNNEGGYPEELSDESA